MRYTIMKNLALIIIALMFCSLCYGQESYFAYKTYRVQPDIYRRDYYEGKAFTSNLGKPETNDFTFPIFSNPANKYVAGKINQMLQISELEILRGFETESIFERISVDGGGIYGSKVEIKFIVQNNSRKMLSVKFDESSCGATCAYWVKYYNFNSGNGDLIQLKDLFTEKGFEKFFAFVTKRRIAQLKNEIRKLPPDERSGFEGISGSYEADDLTDFYIKNNVLYIDGENSFSKNQKFASVEIKRISRFKLSEFKSYLSDYGKSLFGMSNNAVKRYRSNVLPQLFQGKIGDQTVAMVLNTGYKDEMKAEYIYSKYGKGIYLEGKINATELSLTEKLPKPNEKGFINYVDNGFIEAKFDGQNITGNWTSSDKTKTCELKLTRK
jgi:hypothetical protein